MSFYTRNKDGLLTEVPMNKVETLMNNGVMVYSDSDRIMFLESENKILKEALEELIHHCRDYGITSESFAICMAVNQAVQALEKVGEL